MSYSNIDKPSKYFNTVLYTGNGTSQSITGVGFAPDWVWLKNRDSAYYHCLYDSIRGTGTSKSLYSNTTEQEGNQPTHFNLTSFDSDGFTLGTTSSTNLINTSSQNHVSWNWKANGAGVSNTQGSITSTVSANTTSGFSIVSYTGTGANATVGHGLGVAPKMVMIKNRTSAENWRVGHNSLTSWAYRLILDSTSAQTSEPNAFNSTAPTSTVFSVGTDDSTNKSTNTLIAYCFADVKGYSRFGSYTGNGNADGTFVYTGFKPAFVMFKNATTLGTNWQINDSARDTFNVMNKRLAPSASDAEATNFNFGDFLSNGFKIRQTDQTWNKSGDTYIYACFASNPFVSSKGIPCTAR